MSTISKRKKLKNKFKCCSCPECGYHIGHLIYFCGISEKIINKKIIDNELCLESCPKIKGGKI